MLRSDPEPPGASLAIAITCALKSVVNLYIQSDDLVLTTAVIEDLFHNVQNFCFVHNSHL